MSWKREVRILSAIAVLLISTCALSQDTAPTPSEPNIRATTRVVMVDAIVTDAKGQPVSGLGNSDFTILEDGKPQKISFFSHESTNEKDKKTGPPLPKLRPGVFTNRPEYHNTSGPLVIVLMDGLNTPPGQRMYARQQILKYLGDLKLDGPGTAILALGNDLSVLQDFTTDPQLLTAAIRKYVSNRTAMDVESPKINFPVQSQPSGGLAGAPGTPPIETGILTTDPNIDPYSIGVHSNSLAYLAELVARFEKMNVDDEQDVRIRGTLVALKEIGRSMSGYPGRKALLWFSAGFPFSLQLNDRLDLDLSQSYRDQIKETAALLSQSSIAVYPIDARGLFTGTSLSDSSTDTRMAQTSVDSAPTVNLSAETWDRYHVEATMDEMSHDTGGLTFRNSNDLNSAIHEAVNDSSSYYLLAYYPEHKIWDGKFHSIKVNLSDKTLKVRARSGYYAVDPAEWRKTSGSSKDIVNGDLRSLSATGVLFYSHAMNPESKGNATTFELLVDASTISFAPGPDGTYHSDIEFQVGAFGSDGKLIRVESQTAEGNLSVDEYQKLVKNGIPVKVSMTLKPGKYTARLAVRDNLNGNLGTLDMPLIVQ
jgi:VWFA-related protein